MNKNLNKKLLLSFILLFTVVVQQQLSAFAFPIGSSNLKFRINNASFFRPSFASNMDLLNLKNGNVTSEMYSFTDAYDISGDGVVQIGRSVRDSNGNLYITGGFTGKIEVNEVWYESSQGYDLYLIKINTNNEIEWIRTGNGAVLSDDYLSVDGGLAMTIDSENNLYVGGGFVRSMTFRDADGDSVFALTGSSESLLNIELFVAKYDQDGTFEWAMGGESNSEGSESSLASGRNTVADIELDSEGYPYIIGSFSGTNLFGETVSSVGGSDIFIASLDKDGSQPF
ncbi:hypothetical protein EP331_14045 [bacterium]|nr:MAG: hypothetical protein EP331_14045 [bacterium]